MKKIIIFLIILISIEKVVAQNKHASTLNHMEGYILNTLSTYLKINEDYLNINKEYQYVDSTRIKFAENNISYFVYIKNIDTNKYEVELGFSGEIAYNNPLQDMYLKDRVYKPITHIVKVDSRNILVSISDKISNNIIKSFSRIRKLNLNDITQYKKIHDRKAYYNEYMTHESGGISIYHLYTKEKEVTIKYKHNTPSEISKEYLIYAK